MSTARTTRSDYWRIDGAAGDLPIDRHPRVTRPVVRGNDMSMGVKVSGYSDPVEGGGDWPGHEERKQLLLDTYDHAGAFDLHDYGGKQFGYTQTHHDASLLVAIRPPEHLGRDYAGWYLVKSLQNNSTPRQANLNFGFTYLAPLALEDTDPGYRDRSAVSAALEADPL